ncbi:hypothetical protein MNBD_ALPHA05-1279 [hydrothermal vent metagenome]|uniref:YbjN domain-containing protein n=1 Tax=hydrothermal vent metagenome TaxID=652676 RepID=A0A3B0SS52_9ZZZZ
MYKFLGVMAVATVLASSAAAQNSLSGAASPPVVANPTTLISDFDVQSVGPILDELGVVWRAVATEGGGAAIVANAGGALNFYMQPSACRVNGTSKCIGVLIFSPYEGDANSQTVRAFNDRYPFTRTALNGSDGAFITRYEIADFGIPRGNVAASLLNFFTLASRFHAELASAGRTVSLEGYSGDLAAASLNRKGLVHLTGAIEAAPAMSERHNKSFDEATDDILRLIELEDLPRNKIKNFK